MIDWQHELSKVRSKEDLARFVDLLRESLRSQPEKWENPTLDRFLEAAAAWIADMDQARTNLGLEPAASPTWQTFAEILLAASAYE